MRDITCRECGQDNTPGSRFCNNCGQRLPPSTEIICPNCQTPNAQHLFYCDNCGTRLVRENLPTELDAEPDSEPPASEEITGGLRDFFSLPTRKPGHTGKLDPHTLPHWLRTGEKDDDELIESDFFFSTPQEEPKKVELPEIEELTPSSKGNTGDLPDWLLGSNDTSAQLFMPPSDITTEAFLDMMDKEGKAIEDLLAGAGSEEDVDKLNLPDWLSDAVKATGKLTIKEPSSSAEPPEEIPDIFQTSTNIPNWLAELGGIDTGDLQQSAANPPDPKPMSVENWGQSEPLYEESPEWLDQFDEAEVVSSAPSAAYGETRDFELSSWGEPAIANVPLPEWYTELHPSPAYVHEEVSIVEEDISFEDVHLHDSEGFDFDDFTDEGVRDGDDLSDFADDSEEFFFEAEADETPEKVATGMLTDWLDDLDEETADSVTEQAPDDFFFAEDVDEGEEFGDKRIVTSQLTGWLSELESEHDLHQAEASSQDFDWDEAVSETGLPADEVGDEVEAVTGMLTGWLAQLDDETEDEEESFTGSTTFTDWFDTVDEPPAAASDEPLPDWLTGGTQAEEVEKEETADTGFTDFFTSDSTESASSFDAADWLPAEEDKKPAAEDGFTTESAIAEDMPDWLDTLGPSGSMALPLSDDEDVGMTDWLQGLDGAEETGAEDFTGGLFTETQAGEDSELDWLVDADDVEIEETEVIPEAVDPEDDLTPDRATAAAADWFSELPTMAEGSFEAEPAVEEVEAVVEDGFEDFDEADFEEEMGLEGEEIDEVTAVAPTSPSAPEEDEISEEPSPDALPDWFTQLGEIQENPADKAEQDLIQNEDLPAWLSNMKPDVDSHASSMPSLGSIFGDSLPGSLQEIPAELTGADLPDWLQGLPTDFTEGGASSQGDTDGSDSWLLADSENGQQGDAAAQLRSILNELPPPRDPKDDLVKAKIPEWLDALKPKELTGEAPNVLEQPAQKQGALVGIRGVIEIEPIVVEPHTATPLPAQQLTITQEQQQQAMLLRQLAQGEAARTETAAAELSGSPALTRAFFVVLMLIVMGVLVVLPTSFVKSDVAAMPAAVTAAQETVAGVSSGLVLVAFDYTPALGGELDAQAAMMMAELTANGNEVIAVSQFAAGTAVAQTHTNASAYFIPGEAMGLRQIGNCLADGCESLFGQALSTNLSQVQLVIVLTGERSSLINWIEQVGVQTQAPLIAGITQALEPVAAPYVEGGELAGTLNYLAVLESGAETAVNAQTLFQLLLVLILLILFIIQIINHRWGRSRQAKQVHE